MTKRIRMALLCLLAAVVVAGCGAPKEPAKRYPMEGEILGLDPVTHNATIKHGKIGDWMDAMTMEYTVKPDAEFAKLHVGDHIQATVVVQDPTYWVTDVKVVGNAAPAK
jgi:Cu/Ag efflux protein CusF